LSIAVIGDHGAMHVTMPLHRSTRPAHRTGTIRPGAPSRWIGLGVLAVIVFVLSTDWCQVASGLAALVAPLGYRHSTRCGRDRSPQRPQLRLVSVKPPQK
jgi:hypothetical protein